MNIWHDISVERIRPERFTAVIEIPKGSKVKYEMDKETGLLRMDRILYTSRITRRTMALSRAPMPLTMIRWMYWCFVRSRLFR